MESKRKEVPMSPITTRHLFRVDLDSCPLESELPRPLSHTDALADEIVLAVRRGMEPASLAGMTVLGTLMNAAKQTLPISGHISGSSAILPLPEDFYATPGPFTLTVQLQGGKIRHTLLRLTGSIARSSTDQVISSGELLPTLPELLTEIADMHAATKAADEAAQQARQAAQAAAAALSGDAPPIITQTSGQLVTLEDAADRPAVCIVSHIAAAQAGSGLPSPDNVRSITGWNSISLVRTSRNLLPGGTFTFVKSTRVTFDPPLPPGTYTFSATVTSADTDDTVSAVYFNSDAASKANLQRGVREVRTRTFTEPVNYVDLYASRVNSTSADDECTWADVQLEAGDVATAFEPCQSALLTSVLPETVCGGTLDWTTGLLTVTHSLGEVKIFDELYPAVGSGLTCGQANKWPGMRTGGGANGWCSMLPPAASIANRTEPCVSFGGTSSQAIYAAYPASTVGTTLASLNAYVAAHPLQVAYPLAEPYTIQLTPQQLDLLKGCNSIRSSTGDTSVACIADTRLYIDNAIAAIAANLLNT